MGFYRLINIFFICFLSFTFFSYANYPQEIKNDIFFQLSNNQGLLALKKYNDHYKLSLKHDLNLLNTIAEQILIQGSSSSDEYIQKSCILGANWSGSSNVTKILMNGALSNNPTVQLLTINSLDHCRSQSIRQILIKVMSSEFLIIQLEAAYKLALLQDTQVINHLQSTFNQIPHYIQKQLNKIFIHIDHEDAHAYIRKYFGDSDVLTRAETAILAGIFQKDIFLPQLRNLVTRPHHIEQESALFALGELHDQKSYKLIKQFLNSKHSNVRIAAAIALAKIGKEDEAKEVIIERIKQHDLYAITALSSFSNSSAQNILINSMPFFSEEEKFNAYYILLQHGFIDENIINYINNFLILNECDLTASYSYSPGKTGFYIKFNQNCLSKDQNISFLSTQYIKKHLLELIFQLQGNHFFTISESILNNKKKYLIPILSDLIIHKNTPKVQTLLNSSTQTLGFPLIRIYASLSLYKMTGDNKYKQILLEWLRSSAKETLIILEKKDTQNPAILNKTTYFSHSLDLEEKTHLFLKILEILLKNKDLEDISTLINLILYGHPKNLYLLTGLLVKSLE